MKLQVCSKQNLICQCRPTITPVSPNTSCNVAIWMMQDSAKQKRNKFMFPFFFINFKRSYAHFLSISSEALLITFPFPNWSLQGRQSTIGTVTQPITHSKLGAKQICTSLKRHSLKWFNIAASTFCKVTLHEIGINPKCQSVLTCHW